MPDITNPQAIAFCNEQARPAADRLAKAYFDALRVVDVWNSFGGSALIPNTTDLVADGSTTDGRPPVTGAKINSVITRLLELTTDYEAAGNAKLNTILQVAVNTTP